LKIGKRRKAHSFGIHAAKWLNANCYFESQKLLKKLEKNHSSDMLNELNLKR
jgi:DNA mismatch repair protein MutS